MSRYNDAQLEYYADRFVQLRLARRGWTLAHYLANRAAGERRALEAEPLLPAQRMVAERLQRRAGGAQ